MSTLSCALKLTIVHYGSLLKAVCKVLGAFWSLLEDFGSYFGAVWELLGAAWKLFGAPLSGGAWTIRLCEFI